MKAFYKISNNQILLDFERPILQVNLPSFLVNGIAQTAAPGPTTDSLWINCPVFPSEFDDIYVEFKPGTLLYLTGTDRIVLPFIVPVVLHKFNPEVQTVTNTAIVPSVGDYIAAFGLQDAVMISNPENALATSPNEYVIARALEDGEALFNSYVLNAPAANEVLVFPGKRRAILNFARYFLDTRCRRQLVVDDYEKSIKELKVFVESAVVVPVVDNNVYYTGDEVYSNGVVCCNYQPKDCCGPTVYLKGNW